ncbi:MAG: hypothetical protein LBF97_08125 [Elusimicrobiota bacterium]|jgi:hypothetical protein|nr:hypothetical protein [Elusimicrobiota bacterium]
MAKARGLSNKGAVPAFMRFDRLEAKEAAQAFEQVYNRCEKIFIDNSLQDITSNKITELALEFGKLGGYYQRMVEKMHLFSDDELQ